MYSKPQFLQGIYPFVGAGLTDPALLHPTLAYTVPAGKRGQFVYFRAGNSSSELVYVVLMRDGSPMRYFPIGAKADVHVALAVVEDLPGGTVIQTFLAAPEGTQGMVVLDIGLMEI